MTMMISYRNRADGATLTGGSFQPSLPLSNLQLVGLNYPARTTDLAALSCMISVDLGDTHVVRLVGFMRHNLSTDATYRVLAGDAPGVWLYDSGYITVWPSVYDALDMDFEEDDWWLGMLSEEDRLNYPMKLLHNVGSNLNYRYWLFEFVDPTNPAGYLELTRLWMGPVWIPTYNYDWGSPLGWSPRSRSATSLAGARYSERRTPARVFKVNFTGLTDTEGYGRFQDMMRVLESEGELIAIPDPDDTPHRHIRDIYCHVASWGEGATPRGMNVQSASMTLEELL